MEATKNVPNPNRYGCGKLDCEGCGQSYEQFFAASRPGEVFTAPQGYTVKPAAANVSTLAPLADPNVGAKHGAKYRYEGLTAAEYVETATKLVPAPAAGAPTRKVTIADVCITVHFVTGMKGTLVKYLTRLHEKLAAETDVIRAGELEDEIAKLDRWCDAIDAVVAGPLEDVMNAASARRRR